MTARRIDLVIFDNDGVLVDSETIAARVDAELLVECGVDITPAECTRRFLGHSLSSVRAHASGIGVDLPADFEDRYHQRLFAEIAEGLAPVPGATDLVEEVVASGAAMCVASSGDHARIETLQRAAGLRHHFEGLTFSAQDVARGKPAPDLFLAAAEAMGVEPSRCAVIEDSPAGVAAALAAGMTVFGYAGLTPPDLLRDANAGVFMTMADLAAALLPRCR